MFLIDRREKKKSFSLQDECEEQLNIALPALNAAVAALNTLKEQDISLVKTMTNPPQGIKVVLEAICIMKVCFCSPCSRFVSKLRKTPVVSKVSNAFFVALNFPRRILNLLFCFSFFFVQPLLEKQLCSRFPFILLFF